MRRRSPSKSAGTSAAGHRAKSRTSSTAKSNGSNGHHVSAATAFFLLVTARLVSAAFNIVHDCDEVFNYWEPLHYLLYGSGMQTWEYSSQFALRSYLYLLLHAAVGAPAARLFGAAAGKVAVFYTIKAALATLSALTEWWLYKAVSSRYSATLSNTLLAFLCLSSGMFVSASALLPSSFTMYALTAAAAALLQGRVYAVITSAVVGVVWGWVVGGAAFAPYALWVLAVGQLLPSVAALTIGLVTTLVPLVLADKALYGTWKASLWNFILYNVAGGGQSALYGVESADYYLRNGLNQLQLVLPLALALPAIIALAWTLGLKSSPQSTKSGHRRVDLTLAVAVAPFFVWLAAITSLPHKEERFLYVVYPLACLAAAATLDLGSRLVQRVLSGPFGRGFATGGVALAIAATGALSLSRSAALLVGYGAPMQLYKALPPAPPGQAEVNVCVGAEWHRFPSSFFLPGPQYHLRFIKSGFDGLLPRPFADEDGGTRAAPRQLNDQNREEPENYWPDAAQCDYVVTLGPAGRQNGSGSWFDEAALGVAEGWTVMAEQPFVDGGGSPALTRAFFIPGYSRKMNKWLRYALLERRREA